LPSLPVMESAHQSTTLSNPSDTRAPKHWMYWDDDPAGSKTSGTAGTGKMPANIQSHFTGREHAQIEFISWTRLGIDSQGNERRWEVHKIPLESAFLPDVPANHQETSRGTGD